MQPLRPDPAGPERDVAAEASRENFTVALLKTARPRQWAKNVLVAAAPGAAGILTHGDALRWTGFAFVIFGLAASGCYFLNDASDIEADRLHPKKRSRPVAAGRIGVRTAQVIGVLLVATAIGGSMLRSWQLAMVIGSYVAITVTYTAWLKEVAVVDLVAVASGFVLRAIAGAVAVDVPVSDWFLIISMFGSLFMVAGKRSAEHAEMGIHRAHHRVTLGEYSMDCLRHVRAMSAAVAVAAYCLWAFEKAAVAPGGPPWFEISIVPFVMGVLRYSLLLDQGGGGAPEDIVLGDRPLQMMGALWAVLFAAGVYGG